MSIGRMCELAQVSRAAFYRHWQQQEPDAAEMALRDAVERVSLAHPYYGYRRVAVPLAKTEGIVTAGKVVRRIMREDQLLAIRRRRFVRTTDSTGSCRVAINLAQHLRWEMPNPLWVADLTSLRLAAEFVFLAVVLDA